MHFYTAPRNFGIKKRAKLTSALFVITQINLELGVA
jgi:hypothetical protein